MVLSLDARLGRTPNTKRLYLVAAPTFLCRRAPSRGCAIPKRRSNKQSSTQGACDHSNEVAPADQFELDFRAGNKLAPFALARLLEIGGTPPDQVPEWLVKYFISLGANYFADLHDASRTGRYPSLDRLAGLAGTKPRPWNKNAANLRALTVALLFHRLVGEARAGRTDGMLVRDPAIPRRDPRRSELSGGTHFTDGKCEPVRVLDNRTCPRPTKAFQIALGKWLKVVPNPNAVEDDGIYRAVRKCLKKAREIRARHGDI